MSFSLTPHIHLTILSLLAEVPPHFLSLQARSQWCHQGGKLPPYRWTSKNYVMCVLSLSWNFFVTHDKYIARPSSKEPRWYTDNTTRTGGLRTGGPIPHFPPVTKSWRRHCQVSLPCNMLLRTQLLYNLPLIINDTSLLVSSGTNCLNLFQPIWHN